MATKTQKIQHIKQQAEDLFLEEGFGQMDTRGLPISMNELALLDLRDPFAPDEKFAPLNNQSKGFGSLALRRGIEELAERDPEVQRVLREHGVEDLQRPRSFNTPGWKGEMRFDRNAWHFTVKSEEGEQKRFKIAVTDPETAQIQAARYLDRNRVNIRALSKEEELYVARLAGMGKREDAVMNFLAYSVPDFHGTDISTDPKYAEVCNQCAWFVFLHGTPQFQDSNEAREFMTAYIGSRPVTVELLQYAFAAYQEHQKKQERGLIFDQIENHENTSESEPTYENLDALSDEEISRLRQQTLRERAKNIRAGILQ
jgi:hypothetical protein